MRSLVLFVVAVAVFFPAYAQNRDRQWLPSDKDMFDYVADGYSLSHVDNLQTPLQPNVVYYLSARGSLVRCHEEKGETRIMSFYCFELSTPQPYVRPN